MVDTNEQFIFNPEIKIKENIIYFNFNMSLFTDIKLRNDISKYFWILQTYRESKTFQSSILSKTVVMPFEDYLNSLFLAINNLFLKNSLEVNQKNLFISGTGLISENLRDELIDIIESETIKYLNSNKDFFSISYKIAESSISLIYKDNIISTKTVNKTKVINKLLLKKIVNKLSIFTQTLNERSKKLGKTRATYLWFYNGRQNMFDLFDKVLRDIDSKEERNSLA